MNRLEIGAATAIVGAGVYQIHDCYTKHAGTLADARNAEPGDRVAFQRLVDADTLAGGLTLLAGGALAIATGKVYPLLLAGLAFLLVAVYYHGTLNAHPVPGAPEPSEDGAE